MYAIRSYYVKTNMPYEVNPASLLTMACYNELKELGVVSSSVLDTTLTALLELEQVTKELDIPLYQEGKSGIVWALKDRITSYNVCYTKLLRQTATGHPGTEIHRPRQSGTPQYP